MLEAGPARNTAETFADGRALFTVCELAYEGVVAKNRASTYKPGERGWLKVTNPNYWRRDAEREAVARSRDRQARCRTRFPKLLDRRAQTR